MIDIGAGKLLSTHVILERLKEKTKIENISVIISDIFYPHDIQGTYVILFFFVAIF